MSKSTKLVHRATPWLALALVSAVPLPAFAQTGAQAPPAAAPAKAAAPKTSFVEQKTENGNHVVFDDDLASGTAYDPFTDLVRGPLLGARMPLLRPRFNFVPELLKSVENL